MRVEHVEAILKPYHNDLVQCVSRGWQTWRDLQMNYAGKAAVLKTRTRANFVNDYISDEAKSTFSGNPNVILSESYGFLVLSIADLISARFKKLNSQGRTSNIKTRQQRLIYNSDQELPGFSSMRVSIGYILDPLQTEIADVRVVYERGIATWYYSILGKGAVIMDEMVLDTPLETSIAPIVRAKQQVLKKKTGNE